MDNILAQQLLGLGQNSSLRRQNLLSLIPCLTHQEVRELAAGLSTIDMRTDIISRLPLELRLNVARQLGAFDVFPLLNVSRQWRAIWLQPDMLELAAEHWQYIDSGPLSDHTTAGIVQDESIAVQYEFLCRRRNRSLGRFSHAIMVRHNVGEGHEWVERGLELVGLFPSTATEDSLGSLFTRKASRLEHASSRSSLYHGGRLVWIPESLPSPDSNLIVIEDLLNKTKRIFRNPSVCQYGRGMELKALGDKLVVAGTSRVMFIWHLESNQGSQVSLPQQPTCCVTRDEYVALLRPDSALLWRFGCGLTTLDLNPILESNQNLSRELHGTVSSHSMGIFFHPSEPGTVFISVCFTYIRQVIVHMFRAAKYLGAQEIDLREIGALSSLSFNGPPDYNVTGGATACRVIPAVNSSGDFLLAEWRTFTSGNPTEQGVHIPGTTFIELRFNAMEGDFSLREKSLPSGTWGDMHALDLGTTPLLHSWNDQMVFPLQVTQDRRMYGGLGSVERECSSPALVALSLCPPTTTDAGSRLCRLQPATSTQSEKGLFCIPRSVTFEAHLEQNRLDLSPAAFLTLVTAEGESYGLKTVTNSTHTLKSLYSRCDFVLDLTTTPDFGEDHGRVEGPHHIFQDDEFIVLVHRHGYIAWDFRPESPCSLA